MSTAHPAELLNGVKKLDRWDEAIPHWQRVAALRKLEPAGLLKLAAVQIHLKQWSAAKETVTRLQKGD